MDRSYWRGEPTKRLIEEARTKGCELCRVLGERLEDANDEIIERETIREDYSIDLDREISRLHEKLEELELMLGQREDRIYELEAKLKGKK